MARENENDIVPREEEPRRKSFFGFSRHYRGGSLGERDSYQELEKLRRRRRRILAACGLVLLFLLAYFVMTVMLDISHFPVT